MCSSVIWGEKIQVSALGWPIGNCKFVKKTEVAWIGFDRSSSRSKTHFETYCAGQIVYKLLLFVATDL